MKIKKYLYLLGLLFAILIFISIKNIDFFYTQTQATFLAVVSFWITFIALIISIWTLIVAKSIKKAKIDFVKREQKNAKRMRLCNKIEDIKKIIGSNKSLSSRYIQRINEIVIHLEVSEISLNSMFQDKIERFKEIISNERKVDSEKLVIILEEIYNIMEQDNASCE